VTPFLVLRDTAKAIEFYVTALNAKETMRMMSPDGKTIMHAEIMIGDCVICLSEEMLEHGVKSPLSLGGSPSSLYIYVPDVDAAYKQALNAGCLSKMEPADMFWGDRFSSISDPFGHVWSLATHVEDLDKDEVAKRQTAFFKQMAASQEGCR
jgi:uncharacterized glyoxalase superfamily protein PhnB